MEAKYDFERKFREDILKCSRCGYCQAVCPAFKATLRPALNARGKMLLLKEVMEEKLELTEDLIETMFQCTTCAGCYENCPSKVNVPEIIKQARKDMVSLGTCHPAFTGMNKVLQEKTNIYAEDELPDFDKERGGKAEYVYFIGCVGTFREEEASEAVIALLDRTDTDYTLIEEVCCSGVLEDVGFSINTRLANHNVEAIMETGCKGIITGCPKCFLTFKNNEAYAPLREAGIEIIHITQFINRLDFKGAHTDAKITYHDPCDLGRHCGIYEDPRRTISRVAANFVEMEHHHASSLCCGAGGGVRGAYAKNSIAMAKNRLKEALDCGAEVLVTECNSCVHNLSNAKLRSQKIKIMNTTQFINELMEEME